MTAADVSGPSSKSARAINTGAINDDLFGLSR